MSLDTPPNDSFTRLPEGYCAGRNELGTSMETSGRTACEALCVADASCVSYEWGPNSACHLSTSCTAALRQGGSDGGWFIYEREGGLPAADVSSLRCSSSRRPRLCVAAPPAPTPPCCMSRCCSLRARALSHTRTHAHAHAHTRIHTRTHTPAASSGSAACSCGGERPAGLRRRRVVDGALSRRLRRHLMPERGVAQQERRGLAHGRGRLLRAWMVPR